jgi:hypothetical protein
VFALSGAENAVEDGLIRGTSFINDMPCIAIIDTGATHFFISWECANKLRLQLSVVNLLVIDTPAMGLVTIFNACLRCPLRLYDKNFEVDLVCLPLDQLDVILGMDWLRSNHVYINCFAKTVFFLESEKREALLVSSKQVNEVVQEGAELFILLAALNLGEKGATGELPVVCDFPEVFPVEINELPPEREVEFTIDLVPGNNPVSMAPYRMSASELKELKSQLEDLLEKKFIRPSVSPWGAPVFW